VLAPVGAWRRRLGCALLAVGALSGCGGGTSTGEQASSRAITPALWEYFRFAGDVPSQQDEIGDARAKLMVACMRRQGLPYFHRQQDDFGTEARFVSLGAVPGSAVTEQAALRVAARHGFGIAEGLSNRSRESSDDQTVRALPQKLRDRYTFAVYHGQSPPVLLVDGGTAQGPSAGCAPDVNARLYGDLEAFTRATNEPFSVMQLVDGRALREPALMHAQQRWSACMKRRTGLAFTDPANAPRYIRQTAIARSLATRRQMFGLERPIALADVACKYSSGAIVVYARAVLRELRRVKDPEWDALTSSYAANARALTAARHLAVGARRTQ
jgi:hypothetical protein